MSRGRTRARNRAARLAQLRVEVEKVRSDTEAFLDLLTSRAGSGRKVWDVEKVVSLHPDERAMIAQIVAPHLVEQAPRIVRRRDRYTKRKDRSPQKEK